MNFKEDFQNIFDFTPSFFQALFKRWVNNKLKVLRGIFTSYFLPQSIVHYYTHFNKALLDHADSNPCEKTWTSNAKTEYAFFCALSNWFMNKQLFFPLSWNNPLLKTALGELYILMIGRHLDAKTKYSLDVYFLLDCPSANFGWLSRGNLTDPMLITAFGTSLTGRSTRVS